MPQFSVTMVAPFFPTYASDRYSASESLVGITFACNPIAQVASAAAWTVVISKLGREDSLGDVALCSQQAMTPPLPNFSCPHLAPQVPFLAMVSAILCVLACLLMTGLIPAVVIGLSVIALGSLIFSQGESMSVFMIGRCLA